MPDRKPTDRRLKVIVTRRLPPQVETRMKELFDTELNAEDLAFSRQQMIDALGRADVLVPTVTDRLDAEVIAAAGPNLKLIAQFGAGVDNIDVAGAISRGIAVTNTPGVLTEDTADVAMALLLAVPRRLFEGARIAEEGKFQGWTPTWMLGRRIAGKRLGIIGMGRIGQAVARRARAFGLQVHYNNRRRLQPHIETALEATFWDDLDQMLARVDMVSIHCPYTPQTYQLIDARRLALMQPSAVIVNTARGEIIDESALAEALSAGRLAGAGLDVYENEPEIHPGLKSLPNVVLLPHMGSATEEGRNQMGARVLINIRTFADGHMPPDRVVPASF